MTAPELTASTFRLYLTPRLRSWTRTLATVGLMAGIMGWGSEIAPQIGGQQLPELGITIAQAQTTVTNQEVTQYAQAVLQMDGYRNEAYTEIKNLLLEVNVELSAVTLGCSESNLPGVTRRVRRQVENIMITYCNRARDIVDQNGLTAQRFNEITAAHRENEALAERIRQELSRLQAQ
ncbi:DUF4168 domain-containing protein [Leptolyngbya sp. PCC 6406]|uniref:DUF4168 domain-containing protein n=1 Tax=Leptolyngbya sp. PCC 6406 TaxID=1173264 RepID=UPI0002AC8C25|nr:DUF4168 domain-containing protein [Leptolyngbya sp. PCC 6406]